MEYKTKTVKQLRNIAKENGLVRYSGLRKADLVTLVSSRLTTDRNYWELSRAMTHRSIPWEFPNSFFKKKRVDV